MVYKPTYNWGPHPVWKTTLCYPLFMGKRSVNGPLSIAVFFRCSQRIFETLSAGMPQDGLVISTLNNNPRWGPHRPPIWRWRRRSFDDGSIQSWTQACKHAYRGSFCARGCHEQCGFGMQPRRCDSCIADHFPSCHWGFESFALS